MEIANPGRELPGVPAAADVDWTPTTAVHERKPKSKKHKRPSVKKEKRDQNRFSQRELGAVSVALRLREGEWNPVRLYDFSSIGFGIIIPADEGGNLPEPEYGEGDQAGIRIKVEDKQEFEVWCEVKNAGRCKDGLKLGLRRTDLNFPRAVDLERRESYRLPIGPSLSLAARIRHPFIYGHWCMIQASDLNKNMGLSFFSKDESILLFEGMELRVFFELAAYRQIAMRARVTWVNANEANEVRFGVECLDMDFRLHNGICDFLLFSRQWTPARLFGAGFRAQQVKNHLRFRSVKTLEDYAEVLHLRRDAYVGAGKRTEATTPEDMATPLDGKSRILMAHHHDCLVGTITFTFPSSEDTVLDSQSGFPGGKYPVSLPPKANLIEVSRLCIHQEYRGTDVLQGMFEHGLKHFLMSDRHWLLTSAMDDLLPIYERVGFKRLKASYKHPQLNHKEHHLIMASRTAFLGGLGINLFLWNSVFGDLVGYLMSHELVALTKTERAFIRAKLWFRPLSKNILRARAEKAYRRHLEALRQAMFKVPAGDTAESASGPLDQRP
ncbi:MAG TPA: GNAT family N-acyltransferase [Fibrobacteria bacterium]|nr:GNAT family N-acyltransferase [Fibrobacteria bacterium]